jgi:hypothetical protein
MARRFRLQGEIWDHGRILMIGFAYWSRARVPAADRQPGIGLPERERDSPVEVAGCGLVSRSLMGSQRHPASARGMEAGCPRIDRAHAQKVVAQ